VRLRRLAFQKQEKRRGGGGVDGGTHRRIIKSSGLPEVNLHRGIQNHKRGEKERGKNDLEIIGKIKVQRSAGPENKGRKVTRFIRERGSGGRRAMSSVVLKGSP